MNINPKDIEAARLDDPEGNTCSYCGKENDFADDCGWFYVTVSRLKASAPCCQSCYQGVPGRRHIELYGVGDR